MAVHRLRSRSRARRSPSVISAVGSLLAVGTVGIRRDDGAMPLQGQVRGLSAECHWLCAHVGEERGKPRGPHNEALKRRYRQLVLPGTGGGGRPRPGETAEATDISSMLSTQSAILFEPDSGIPGTRCQRQRTLVWAWEKRGPETEPVVDWDYEEFRFALEQTLLVVEQARGVLQLHGVGMSTWPCM